jgi:hypothetical protein
MSSPARSQYLTASAKAELLQTNVGLSRGRFTKYERSVQYAASLAAHVAAWESYLENLVQDFITEISDPLDMRYTALSDLFAPKVEQELKRFNTPKYDNARTLVATCTGYDPINDWNWPARRMGGPAVRILVDEIVNVRHCFAHGTAMKSYDWNTSTAGQVRLTVQALVLVRGIFGHLVSVTDRQLDAHIRATYGLVRSWY